MVVGAVVSCERDDRVGQWILSPGIICAWRAGGEWRSASFEANGGARLRQEFARRLLCNRQWSGRWRTPVRISPRPVRVRKGASPGQGNERGNTIGRSARNTAERFGRTVHPRATLPDRAVPWVLRPLRSSHPPRHERGSAGKGRSAGALHYANFVHPAASNIHPPVGGCRHIANCTSSRGDHRTGELFRFWIELNDGVWLHSRFAVPNQAIRRNGDGVRSGARSARRRPHSNGSGSWIEPAQVSALVVREIDVVAGI